MIAASLLKKYPIISDQVDERELGVVLAELENLLQTGTPGSIVEFGCYTGSTSLFIARLLTSYNSISAYHVFDSFMGLPAKTSQDSSAAGEQFKAGELFATKKQFITNFKKAGLPLPIIHKGWFSEVPASDIPSEIMFAFLDGDYYQSINDSFRLITPNLAKNFIIIVDDYTSAALPGAAKATDEWVSRHACKIRTQASLAIIQVR
jgi:O-methyltransferase